MKVCQLPMVLRVGAAVGLGRVPELGRGLADQPGVRRDVVVPVEEGVRADHIGLAVALVRYENKMGDASAHSLIRKALAGRDHGAGSGSDTNRALERR